ncbi:MULTISPECIES: glycosyltransferase [unclassified Cupriavidus]|uniref:glycosyltransferase n=1 Tax=unclassified Cupriavidus TaxID=2640874 RepID=UPI0003FFCB71|nr:MULTISPECIES: glycosyltransferase [unclassified Cupriavidus]MBP0634011.1 glycosyltransferase [Cupriavidus sp. AcVe19-6a]
MRILLLTTGLRLGGAERQVADLARQFVAFGHEVAVISLTLAQEVVLPAEVMLHRVDLHKDPLRFLFTLHSVRKWVGHWQPDIVHAHMFHANIFARLLRPRRAGGARIPVLCTAHSSREGGKLRMLAYRLTDGLCAATTHVSAEGMQYMLDVGATKTGRISVMPNGIDTDQFRRVPQAGVQARQALGIGPDARVVLNVGRLVHEKDQRRLIEAFRQLADDPETGAGICLLIAGDGPLKATLIQHAAALGLSHAVRLLGPCDNVPALMNAADLFVLSSMREGLPLVVAEALACETPLVATDVSGIRALLAASGSIVPAGDTDALARGMRAALLGRQDVAAGRVHAVAAYSLASVAQRWIDLYRELVQRRGAALPHASGKADHA